MTSRLLAVSAFLALLSLASVSAPADAAAPRPTSVVIDAAPSVVSYQGSSARTHGKLVIAPMGRSLGYVEPTNLNRTQHREPARDAYAALDLSPVYVHQ